MKGGEVIRTLTLIAAIAVATVAIAPAALGEGQLAPLYPPSAVASYQDAGQRHAARPSTFNLFGAADRLQVATVRDTLATYRDAAQRAVPISTAGAATAEAHGVVPSRDVDWPQLGIGFALGIALTIVLWLAVQVLRARPLAH